MKKNLLIIGLCVVVALLAYHSSTKNHKPQPTEVQTVQPVRAATAPAYVPPWKHSVEVSNTSVADDRIAIKITGLHLVTK